MMHSKSTPVNPVRYWRQELLHEPQNFGDFLTEILLENLFLSSVVAADAYHLIGSVISDNKIEKSLLEVGVDPRHGSVAFWGCGLRVAEDLDRQRRQQALILGVRGVRSRDVLGLPPATPLGDPGLLLPLLHAVRSRHGGTLCITHFHEPRDASDIRNQTGVDEVISARIPASRKAMRSMIDRIAGASFVLAGALHGAIVACAYGVPFAFFDSGYVNVPFKWDDFASSIGVPCVFARDLDQGRQIYREVWSRTLRLPPLSPLLMVAPFAVRRAPFQRSLIHDGVLTMHDSGLR